MCGGPEIIEGAEIVGEAAKGAGEVAGATEVASTAGPAALGELGSEAAVASINAADAGTIAKGLTDAEVAGGAFAPAAGAAAGGAAGAAVAGAAGSKANDLLTTVKTVAPVVAAGASLIGAGAAVQQAQNAKAAVNGAVPATPPAVPQGAIEPDVSAIRKKNSLLFGVDSPANTDITQGKAGLGSLGRATLLGGSSRLGD